MHQGEGTMLYYIHNIVNRRKHHIPAALHDRKKVVKTPQQNHSSFTKPHH